MSCNIWRDAATSTPATFTAPRFVLLSSRESVGGGPYLTEEVFPLHEARSTPSVSSRLLQPAKSLV